MKLMAANAILDNGFVADHLTVEPRSGSAAYQFGIKAGHLVTPDGDRVWNVEGFHANGDLCCTACYKNANRFDKRIPDDPSRYAPLTHTNHSVRFRNRLFLQARGGKDYRLGEVESPAHWDTNEIAATVRRFGDLAIFALPNGWTRTKRTLEDGSVSVPCGWFDFLGYGLVMPSGDHAVLSDWHSAEQRLELQVGNRRLTVDEREVYASWKWGHVSLDEKAAQSKLVGNSRGHADGRPAQWLYRMYDEHGALLYVGITDSATRRWRQHEREKYWFDEVARFERQAYPDRESVEEAERLAIATERPRYNVIHNASQIAA